MLKQLLHDHWTVQAVGDLSEVSADLRGRVGGEKTLTPILSLSRERGSILEPGGGIPATVPGCIHTDLLAAGLIPDPYLDRNEELVQWIGRTDWRYTCHFEVSEDVLQHERVDLVCEGLDTLARIELNGQLLGETANMHHPHRFDAKTLLKPGRNDLSITFASAEKHVKAMQEKLGYRPHVGDHPFNYLRKMACNFGWDWGPTLITCGIWRRIRLEAWNVARIVSVRPTVSLPRDALGEIQLTINLEWAGAKRTVQVDFQYGDTNKTAAGANQEVSPGTEQLNVKLPIHRRDLWWPYGHGAQPGEYLRVSLVDAQQSQETLVAIAKAIDANLQEGQEVSLSLAGFTRPEVFDRWEHWFALRTVCLNTDTDLIGSKFQIEINGRPIFCKGANWIPDDCFPHRITRERYRERLQQAVDAGINMLRVWGGGLYESDDFYDLCDEMGIMVWQDFLFACAAYPEEEPYRTQVEQEVRHNVARLSRHPSLVLWNGNNENIWGWFDWGWRLVLTPLRRTWGLGYYLDLLPKLVKEIDPSRPYWPGSPYSGSMDIHPQDDAHGTRHVWDVWNEKDYGVYRRYTPRFVSEFGFQGPPTYATLAEAVPVGQRSQDSPAFLQHQKAKKGNDKLAARLADHFRPPTDFDDWLYLTQLNQARAVTLGVEWYRALSPVCMGTLYWQLNDCWPVTSWAAIDGSGRRKPLWYATRRFFADSLLTIQPEPTGALVLHAINDNDELWSGAATVTRMDFVGNVLHREVLEMAVPARGRQRLAVLEPALSRPRHPSREMIVAEVQGLAAATPGAEAPGTRALWFFDADKNLAYPSPQFESRVERDGPDLLLHIMAAVLLRDLAIFADRLDPQAQIDDQLVTLLPGESRTFRIRSPAALDVAALTAPPVLQSANRFGAGV